MADIHLGSADNIYVQLESEKDQWNNVYGDDGNDTIKLYQGTAIGGKGNDRFEKIVIADQPWRELQVAYWNAGANLKVNLAEGWADDGEGGRDTLIGVNKIHGSNGANAWIQGDANDNYYWPNGGVDTFLGGAGTDGISINSWFEPVPGQPWRQPLFADINIVVSVDGRNATVTPKIGTAFLMSLTDVEYFDAQVVTSGPWVKYFFADFITPQSMAEQAIAAGSGLRWNAAQPMGTATTLSYSFVTTAPAGGVGAAGFRAFTPAEQQLVRDILAKTAALANLTFNEVTEVAATVGQLRFGVSQQAATKGVSWLPGQVGAGDQSGDVWMDVESMLGLGPGSEGYQALLHEIGHALGLRHPRNVDAGDAWANQLRASDDRTALTAMSDGVSADGLFRSDWGPLDVLAMRYLYGTRSFNTGDTTYTLGAAQASAQTNITDDGGIDTLSATAYATGVNLNLAPGRLSSVGQTSVGFAGVDNLGLTATTQIENAVGSPYDDVLTGNDLDNRLTGGLGNDAIDGGKGVDTAAFAGARADYELTNSYGTLYVRARDGISGFDGLINIERLAFSDLTITLVASALSVDINRSVDEDAVLSGALPDPTDLARSSVSFSLNSQAGHGLASVTVGGNFSYTAAANYWGPDQFSYSLTGPEGSNRYLVFVNVLPINDGAPVAANATYIVPTTAPFNGQLPGSTDVDGDAVTYSLGLDPSKGVAAVSANGGFSYLGNANAFGDDSFTYLVSDGNGGSNTYTVTVKAGLVATEDTVLQQLLPDPVGLLRTAVTYSLAANAGHGNVSVSAQGLLVYTPAANYFGSDAFAYNVTGPGGVTRVDVALRVTSVNDGPPVASASAFEVNEDVLYIGSLPSAIDPDNTAITYSLGSAGAHGTVTIQANGQFSFLPAANYVGSDSFSYTVTDAEGGQNSYPVAVTIRPVNDAPTSSNASAQVNEDALLSANLPAAADVDGDALSYSRATNAGHGDVTINANGSYVYTPAANYNGPDSFTFKISDVLGAFSTYTLTITINPVNDAPVSSDGSASVNEDTVLNGSLPIATDVDGDALTYTRLTNPAHGSVVVLAGGSYAYTPATNYNGPDSFTFSVADGKGGSSTSTQSITVNPVNDAPAASHGSASVNEDTVLNATLPVATDVEGDALTYSRASHAAHGTVLVNPNGSYSVTPEANYAGADAFNYLVSDGKGGLTTRTITLTINNVVDTFTGSAGDDVLTGYAGGDRYLALAGNDTITPGAGNDTVDGGDGFDRVSYADASQGVVANLATGVVNIGTATDSLSNVESLWGSPGNDSLTGSAASNAFFGGAGNDTLDGGAGLDVASFQGGAAVNVNLLTGLAARGAETDTLIAIEAIFGSSLADTLTGLNGNAIQLGETFRPAGGNDTVSGGAGVDTVEFSGPRSAYSVVRASLESDALTVTHNAGGSDGSDSLMGVERLLFADSALAFGSRAEELAKVVFVLWSPAVASNKVLLGTGINFYDRGHSFDVLIETALSFWTALDNISLALKLIDNVPGTSRSGAELLAAMSAKPGLAGRVDATRIMANDAANLANIDVAHLRSDGIVCALTDGSSIFFAPLLPSVNARPVGANGNTSVNEDATLSANLPAATDADGDAITFSRASQAAHGSITVNADGSYSYVPEANYFGADSFNYSIGDGQGGSSTYTLTLSVTAVNDAPQASDGNAATNEDTPLTGNLPAASDVDGDALTYSRVNQPAQGSVVVNANGSFTLTPEANYSGTDSFSFSVSDGKGGSVTRSLALTINSVIDTFTGTAAADLMPAYAGADRYQSAAGNDTIQPGAGDDSIDGGDGFDRVSYAERSQGLVGNLVLGRVTLGSETDVVTNVEALIGGSGNDSLVGDALANLFAGGAGNDSINGGGGFDIASYVGGSAVNVNLLTGVATQGSDTDTLINIEALFGSNFADTFTGLNGDAVRLGETFRPGGGNDSVNGGTGVDTVEYSGSRAAYTISRPSLASDAMTVAHNAAGPDGSDSLAGVERLLFSDGVVAFGSRAVDVAKVAFVLWAPGVATNKDLFGVGVSFYDKGFSYDFLIETALSFWTVSDALLVQQLISNVPGTSHTTTELLNAITAKGGGLAGRIEATRIMADDSANLANIDLAGLRSNGIECVLGDGTTVFFGPLPGG